MAQKSVLEVLADKGYVISYNSEEGSETLVHGEDYVLTSSVSDDRVELMLWDDFFNPFKLEDFDTIEDYADAIIKRFHGLAETANQ